MAIKSFNLNEDIYDRFSKTCKENGISMSRQVEMFMESQLGDREEIKPGYLKKLKKIQKGKYHKFNTVKDLRKAIEG